MSRKGLPNLSHRPSRAAAETLWQEQALCQQVPADWFPAKGDREAADEAKRVCRLCPVIGECLEYALTHDEWAGVWGGMSERQRRELKRARREKARRFVDVPATGMVTS